jgi:hypothetical protein
MSFHLERGIALALEDRDWDTACRLLGSLGVCHQLRQNPEAMWTSWERGLELARLTRSWHEARILNFQAAYWFSEGRIALCRDLMLEAVDRAQAVGPEAVEIRFLMDFIGLLDRLGCWGAMERYLPRAEALLRRGSRSPQDDEIWSGRIEELRLRVRSRGGDRAGVGSAAETLFRRIAQWPPNPVRIRVHLEACRTLLRCGQTGAALEKLREGIDLCREHNIPEEIGGFHLETAEAAMRLGRMEAADSALAAFRASPNARNRFLNCTRGDILAVRIAEARQGTAAARDTLARALSTLALQRRELGAGVEADLALGDADDLRTLAHHLWDETAEAGYAFEMDWRAQSSRAARNDLRAGVARPTSTDWNRLRARLKACHALHVVYQVQKETVVRWTAAPAGVACDTLALPASVLAGSVDRARELALPGGGAAEAEMKAALYALARILLPSELFAPGSPHRLLVSGDGFLRDFPFEILNVSPVDYHPLLLDHDVAYVRFDANRDASRPGPGIVISAPLYPPALARRYSVLTEPLPYGALEAAAFQARLPHSRRLAGAGATKSHLRDEWKNAGALYFTGHMIEDPEVPFIRFIPLAEDTVHRAEESYLELSEIRETDLSHVSLVVLSGCSSGSAPHEAGTVIPTLAEAFVDAGARAVVSTFWDVRDTDGARVMRGFAAAYDPAHPDPVTALNRARRELLVAGAPPAVWGGYGVLLGAL